MHACAGLTNLIRLLLQHIQNLAHCLLTACPLSTTHCSFTACPLHKAHCPPSACFSHIDKPL